MPPPNPAINMLPEFHDDLLVVQFRPAASGALNPSPLAPASPTIGFSAAPGLTALSIYERAGMIREVIPLGLKQPRHVSAGMGPLAMAAAPTGHESSSLAGLNMIRLEKGADEQQVRLALAQDPHVEAVSRVPTRYLVARRAAAAPITTKATPPGPETMWNLRRIRWQQAVDSGINLATEIKVAVLDTGIDVGHPDLPGDQINYVYTYPSAGAGTSNQDVVGHGTHVAGTIRAAVNNGTGINGICQCSLSAYKIFGDQASYLPPPFGSFAYLVDPILYRAALAACLDAGVAVINLSIGGYGAPDTAEKLLFQELLAAGTTIVAAMGNDNTSQKSYPAAIPGVVAVAATKVNDVRASFSNYGAHVTLSAPGVGIWSTLPTYPGQSGFYAASNSSPPSPGLPIAREIDYDAWDGTSMASPHVAAAAALALAKYGSMTPAQLKEKLTKAVDLVDAMQGQTFTNLYGYGRLNLMKI